MSENSGNKKGKRKGLITTVLVHACLLVLCLFLGFTYVTPPIGDVSIGFEALGEADAGGQEELATSEKVENHPQETTESQVASQNSEEDVATQENSEVAVSRTQESTKEVNTENTKPVESTETTEKPREVDPSLKNFGSLLQGPDNPGGKGAGEKEGNEGTAAGNPTDQGNGGGGKDGMFDLRGRKALVPGDLTHNCGERGRVDVRVKVNKAGKVVSAERVGGTNFSNCLKKIAIAAAKATEYTSRTTGPQFQEGIISLNFHVN